MDSIYFYFYGKALKINLDFLFKRGRLLSESDEYIFT